MAIAGECVLLGDQVNLVQRLRPCYIETWCQVTAIPAITQHPSPLTPQPYALRASVAGAGFRLVCG